MGWSGLRSDGGRRRYLNSSFWNSSNDLTVMSIASGAFPTTIRKQLCF